MVMLYSLFVMQVRLLLFDTDYHFRPGQYIAEYMRHAYMLICDIAQDYGKTIARNIFDWKDFYYKYSTPSK